MLNTLMTTMTSSPTAMIALAGVGYAAWRLFQNASRNSAAITTILRTMEDVPSGRTRADRWDDQLAERLDDVVVVNNSIAKDMPKHLDQIRDKHEASMTRLSSLGDEVRIIGTTVAELKSTMPSQDIVDQLQSNFETLLGDIERATVADEQREAQRSAKQGELTANLQALAMAIKTLGEQQAQQAQAVYDIQRRVKEDYA
jgi:hypothetical protein